MSVRDLKTIGELFKHYVPDLRYGMYEHFEHRLADPSFGDNFSLEMGDWISLFKEMDANDFNDVSRVVDTVIVGYICRSSYAPDPAECYEEVKGNLTKAKSDAEFPARYLLEAILV
jgi:hypothetical protein